MTGEGGRFILRPPLSYPSSPDSQINIIKAGLIIFNFFILYFNYFKYFINL